MRVKDRVIALLHEGKSYRDIERLVGCSKSVISYHASIIGHKAEPFRSRAAEIVPLIEEGLSNHEIASRTGASQSTIWKYRRITGIVGDAGKEYNWNEVREKYKELKSVAATLAFFGMPRGTWHKARKSGRLDVKLECRRSPLDSFLKLNGNTSSCHLRWRLLDEGILDNCCSLCNQGPEWQGRPLTLQLDHINGDNTDNRLENLRILCPNCHTQTDTFAGRKRRLATSTSPTLCGP